MTQQIQKEIIVLVFAAAALLRSVFPTPIVNLASKERYKNQPIARSGLVTFGIFALWVLVRVAGSRSGVCDLTGNAVWVHLEAYTVTPLGPQGRGVFALAPWWSGENNRPQ